jgi:hypothetical protein
MRKDMKVSIVTTQGRDNFVSPESQINVTTTSSMTNAELKPKTMRVKNNRTAQKFAPGIWSTASGKVKKPTTNAPSLNRVVSTVDFSFVVLARNPRTEHRLLATAADNRQHRTRQMLQSSRKAHCYHKLESHPLRR